MHGRLPTKYERHAPRWDGVPRALEQFLDDYSDLCDELGIVDLDEKKITSLLRYAPNSDVRYMWKLLSTDPRVRANWNEYRKIIIENTPGAEEERRYTKSDLKDLVYTSRDQPMQTWDHLNNYWQQFILISESLRVNGRLSEGQRYDAFLQGLPGRLRHRVQIQICAEYPRKHPEDPLSLADTFRVTSFVLSAYGDDLDHEHDDFEPHSRLSRRGKTPVSVNLAARQAYDGSPIPNSTAVTPELTNTLAQVVGSLKRSMEAFSATLGASTSGYIGSNMSSVPRLPSQSQNEVPRPRSPIGSAACVACSEHTHVVQDCEELHQAMSQDRCRLNSDGWVCYPDGTIVTPRSAPGRNMLERIGNWHRIHPAPIAPIVQNGVYSLGNIETLAENISRYSESLSRPLPIASSLPKASPQRQVKVHSNEIFSTTTKASDDDIDKEISLLEIMVQEAQRKLEVARSKTELLSDTHGQRSESRNDNGKSSNIASMTSMTPSQHTSSNSHVFPSIGTPATFANTENAVSSSQYQYETSIEEFETFGDAFKRSPMSDMSPIVVSTYELASATPKVGDVASEVLSSRPVPPSPPNAQGPPTGAKHGPTSHDTSPTHISHPISDSDVSTTRETEANLITPSSPSRNTVPTALTTAHRPAEELSSIKFVPEISAEASLSGTESQSFQSIPSQSFVPVESTPLQSSVFVEFPSFESIKSTPVEYCRLAFQSFMSVEDRSVELRPPVPVKSEPSTSVEYLRITPRSSTSIESESHTPTAPSPPHPPPVPFINLTRKMLEKDNGTPTALTSAKTLPSSYPFTHSPKLRNLTRDTNRIPFDPGGEHQERIHVDPGGCLWACPHHRRVRI